MMRKRLAETAKKLAEEKRQGWRLADGRWRGERFGEVPGVGVGTVFGKGDYQRKGRTEMMETGFFRPWVTPEWFEPHAPVRAAIVVRPPSSMLACLCRRPCHPPACPCRHHLSWVSAWLCTL